MHRASALYTQAPPLDDSELVRRYGKIIDRVARSVASRSNGHISADDLWSAGALGLIEAARRFDSSRAVRFESFVEHRIRGAMLDEMRKLDHLPRRLRDDTDKVKKARNKLSQELGRDATVEELATETGFEIENIANLDAVGAPPTQLVDDLPIAFDKMGADEELERVQAKKQLTDAISKLPERHALVLSLHYVEELTYREIAAILEVSEARVCQIHSDALSKVRGIIGPTEP